MAKATTKKRQVEPNAFVPVVALRQGTVDTEELEL